MARVINGVAIAGAAPAPLVVARVVRGHYSGGAYTGKATRNRRGTRWAVELHYSPNY